MSTEQNKARLRRLFEDGLNQRNLDLISELIGPDYVNHNLPAPEPGSEGFKGVINMFVAAFPDLRVTHHDLIAEGDRVATRGSWSGTHQGEFMGIPATGKQVTVNYIDIWRSANDQFVENWVQMDMLGLMQQLGVIPAPEGSAA